jgi:hypothetical protein
MVFFLFSSDQVPIPLSTYQLPCNYPEFVSNVILPVPLVLAPLLFPFKTIREYPLIGLLTLPLNLPAYRVNVAPFVLSLAKLST